MQERSRYRFKGHWKTELLSRSDSFFEALGHTPRSGGNSRKIEQFQYLIEKRLAVFSLYRIEPCPDIFKGRGCFSRFSLRGTCSTGFAALMLASAAAASAGSRKKENDVFSRVPVHPAELITTATGFPNYETAASPSTRCRVASRSIIICDMNENDSVDVVLTKRLFDTLT
jgi:hypothetical protein